MQCINLMLFVDFTQRSVFCQFLLLCEWSSFCSLIDVVMVDTLPFSNILNYFSRCVTNQRALLESGTMGAKGHVQVIIPHLTESYASQSDPHDEDVPYCTLKSFPATIEHCIQWARDKFESSFVQKPSLFNKFWSSMPSPMAAVEVSKRSTGGGLARIVTRNMN